MQGLSIKQFALICLLGFVVQGCGDYLQQASTVADDYDPKKIWVFA